MADAKLTALTAASALAAADLFYVSQSAASRKATGTQLLALVGAQGVHQLDFGRGTCRGRRGNGLAGGRLGGWLAGCRKGRACEKAGQDETQGVTAEILHLGLSNGNSGKTIRDYKAGTLHRALHT